MLVFFIVMKNKFLLPGLIFISIIVIVTFLSLFLYSQLKITLPFPEGLTSKALPAPQGTTISINGVDGSRLDFGVPPIETLDIYKNYNINHSAYYSPCEVPSEEIYFSDNNLKDISNRIDDLEIGKWEPIFSVPASLSSFNLIFTINKSTSSLATNFCISTPDVREEIIPGEKKSIKNIKRDNVSSFLSQTKIMLEYDDLYLNFYNNDGVLETKINGRLTMELDIYSKIFIFLGVWAFVIALLLLFKTTIALSKEVSDLLKNHKY